MTKQEILEEFNNINYVYNNSSKHETLSWMLDELLKEQEAIEPKEIINDFYPVGDYRRTLGWHCGKCGRTLMGDGNFCSYCGQAVKWDK